MSQQEVPGYSLTCSALRAIAATANNPVKNETNSQFAIRNSQLNQATHEGWGFYLPWDTTTISPTRGEVLNLHFFHKLIDYVRSFESIVDAIILDTINLEEDRVGGTGMIHDWSLSAKIVQETSLPVILAGGLNPKNVADAIKLVKPYAVDVNSGVKNYEGFKDLQKVTDFVHISKIEFFRVSGLI
jgi:hypothetical protein